MERGSVVVVSAQGDYGKPRPAVVISATWLIEPLGSVSVCLMTSEIIPAGPMRITVEPTASNDLRNLTQIQIDKIMTFPCSKVRGPIGNLTERQRSDMDRGLLSFLDLAHPSN